MKIYDCELRFDKKFISKWNFIQEVNFDIGICAELYNKFSQIIDCDSKILNTLKLFNKNIISFNAISGIYYVDYNNTKTRLGLRNLSRGEKLFLLCMMANELKEEVIVCGELNLLSQEYIVKFLELYGYSPYIEILPPTVTCRYIYERLLQTLLNS